MPAGSIDTRIRLFRERLNLSVADLAKAAGLDERLITAIEAGDVYPSIGTLARLARALGQRLGTFMDDQYREDPLIVRRADRKPEQASHKSADPLPFSYFPLGRGKTDRHMEPFFIEIAPGAAASPSSHEGEEFIACLSGRVKIVYGGAVHRLEPGDSIYYNSVVPHDVSAEGSEKAEIYAVVYAPF